MRDVYRLRNIKTGKFLHRKTFNGILLGPFRITRKRRDVKSPDDAWWCLDYQIILEQKRIHRWLAKYEIVRTGEDGTVQEVMDEAADR